MKKEMLLIPIFLLSSLTFGGGFPVSATPVNCPYNVVAGPITCYPGGWFEVTNYLGGDGVRIATWVQGPFGKVLTDFASAECPLDVTCY